MEANYETFIFHADIVKLIKMKCINTLYIETGKINHAPYLENETLSGIRNVVQH